MLSASFEPSPSQSKERGAANRADHELLDLLPLSSEQDAAPREVVRREQALRARELAVESRESDLAEWEQVLEGRESDLRHRETALEWRLADSVQKRAPGDSETTGDSELSAQLDRKVKLMNDLLKELTVSQTENLAERKALDEQAKDFARRDVALDQLEASLEEATSDVTSAQVTVTAQQDELEQQRSLVRGELRQLQADRQELESDRRQMQELLESLREERATLQRERERYLLECGPGPRAPAGQDESVPTAAETAASADAAAEKISHSIAAELQDDSDRFGRLFGAPRQTPTPPSPAPVAAQAPTAAEYELNDCDENSIAEYMDRLLNRARRSNTTDVPAAPRRPQAQPPAPTAAPVKPVTTAQNAATTQMSAVELAPATFIETDVAPVRARPRPNTEEIRAGIQHLRQVANQSAHSALSKHFWKRHRSAVTIKIALVIMSFSLATVLYMDHGVTTSSFTAVAWGAAAIGLITASNLVHTLTELNRLTARFQQETFGRQVEDPSTTIS